MKGIFEIEENDTTPYKLRQLSAARSDWQIYHDIQRKELFAQQVEDYDADFHDSYFVQPVKMRLQLLLEFQEQVIGITTLDILEDGQGVSRLIAISEAHQGAGHGKELGKLVQSFALTQGVENLHVNADPHKVDYYKKLGFSENIWDENEIRGVESQVQQMTCTLQSK